MPCTGPRDAAFNCKVLVKDALRQNDFAAQTDETVNTSPQSSGAWMCKCTVHYGSQSARAPTGLSHPARHCIWQEQRGGCAGQVAFMAGSMKGTASHCPMASFQVVPGPQVPAPHVASGGADVVSLQHPLQSQPKMLLISLQVCNLDTSEQLTVPILVQFVRHGSGGREGGIRGGGEGESELWQHPLQSQPFSLRRPHVVNVISSPQVAWRHCLPHTSVLALMPVSPLVAVDTCKLPPRNEPWAGHDWVAWQLRPSILTSTEPMLTPKEGSNPVLVAKPRNCASITYAR